MPSYDNLPALIGRIASDVTTNGSNDIDGTRMRNLLIDTVNTLLFLLGSVPSSTIATFPPWDEAETYVGGTEVVVQDGGKLYLFVSDVNNIGTVPGTNALIWEEFSALQLAHFQDKDHALDYGGPNQVTAQEIREHLDAAGGEGATTSYVDAAVSGTTVRNVTGDEGGSYELQIADGAHGNITNVSDDDPVTVYIPPHTTVHFPIGCRVVLAQGGEGALSIVIGTGVTIVNPEAPVMTTYQGQVLTAIQIAEDVWYIVTGGSGDTGYTDDAVATESSARAAADTALETSLLGAVSDAIDALIGGAPGALDTLSELADAFGDDADFAATMVSLLAAKAPLDSPEFTNTPKAPTPSAGDNSTRLATTAYSDGGMADHLSASDPHGTLAAVQAGVDFANSPTAPTPTAGDNSTKLATTAFSNAAMAAHLSASDPHSDRAFFDTLSINPQTGTTYTLVLADGKATAFVTLANASAITLTVPLNSSVAFPVGTVINCSQQGAGAVTVAAAGGVTINSPGTLVTTIGKGAMFSLMKVATNEWNLYGMLQA